MHPLSKKLAFFEARSNFKEKELIAENKDLTPAEKIVAVQA